MVFSLLSCAGMGDKKGAVTVIPVEDGKDLPKGFRFDGNTIYFTVLDSVIKIRYMDHSDTDLFFLKHEITNPFLNYDSLREKFFIFEVTIANKTKNMMRFNPKRASVNVSGQYFRGSLDYSEVLVRFNRYAPMADPAPFKKTMYDIYLDIPPGTAVEGLLIFPELPGSVKKFIILVQDVYISDRSFAVPFEFKMK
jgi:hypothetical protein